MGSLGLLLGPVWGSLGALWGRLGRLLGRLGLLLGRLGAQMGRLRALVGASWAVLEQSGKPLEPSWAVLGPTLREPENHAKTVRKSLIFAASGRPRSPPGPSWEPPGLPSGRLGPLSGSS